MKSADNYDMNAEHDDGGCIYYGCMDATACNYDETSNTDDGSCYYVVEGYDCDGVCLADEDGDGVCDPFEVAGCQDATACNYNEFATDAADCVYPDGICDRAPVRRTAQARSWTMMRTTMEFVTPMRW